MSTSTPGKLVLRFDDDFDGTGKLWANGSANGFAGEGAAWVGSEKLEEFAEALSQFPISEKVPPTISGGFWSKVANELSQEHLFIQVYPADGRGHLNVLVRLATEVWPNTQSAQHRVQFEILTGYQALLEFSQALKAVVQGKAEEAILIGDV